MDKKKVAVPLVCHGHSRPVVDLFYSPITPDGFFLISASKGDCFIRFWTCFCLVGFIQWSRLVFVVWTEQLFSLHYVPVWCLHA